eukprot:TRINITY_DN1821_c0_g1_i1.p1 TRINITY_DN1821_c0_g1~~TRINITY_DN1821_c0_g1_i1.p1  ORF type:complete len:911 (-),score=157.16 TRINITY_DN1821_c0_g1_i1:87-2741(-)
MDDHQLQTGVVSWLGVGVLLSPALATFLLFLVLFYPRKLSFSECLFTSFPTSQAFTAVFIFFIAGFSYGNVNIWFLRAFVGGCAVISFLLLLFMGAVEKLGHAFITGAVKEKKVKCVVITVLTLFLLVVFLQLYIHHTLAPNYQATSDGQDPFTLVEDNAMKRKIVGYRTRGASWSDLPMHMGVINSFRVGINSEHFTPLDVKSVLFSGTEMGMPILSDFHSALLCLSGFDLRTSIVLPSTLLTTSLFLLLFLFSFRFVTSGSETNNTVILGLVWGLVSLLLVVFSGGSGFLSFVGSLWGYYKNQDDVWSEGRKLLSSVDYIQNYGQGGRELYWFSFIHHVLVPQRGPAYSYPLFVSVLLFLWRSLEFSQNSPNKQEELLQWRKELKTIFAFSGIIGGLSPLMLSSTYLSIWLLGGILFFLDIKKWMKDVFYLFHWIGFFVPLFVIGYFQVTTVLIRSSSFQNWGSLDFNPIVTSFGDSIDKSNVLDIIKKFAQMWFDGLGIFVVVFLYSLSSSYSNPLRLRFYLAALGIFVFANVFQINVWVRDNIRIFYCWHFIASACISHSFSRLVAKNAPASQPATKGKAVDDGANPPQTSEEQYNQEERDENVFIYLNWIVVFSLIVLLIASGILPTVRETELNYDLYGADDVACGHWIIHNTAKSDVFLTSDAHIHPAFSLAGRPVALTFPGWLWSQGFEYKERQDKVDEALLCRSSSTTTETLKELKIKYIVFDEKFNTTLRNRIDQVIEEESKDREPNDGEKNDETAEEDDTISSPLPPKEMLSCLESRMLKVYENAKYQIYLLSLEDSNVSDEDAEGTTTQEPTTSSAIRKLQDEDEDEEDEDEDEDEAVEEEVAVLDNSAIHHSDQNHNSVDHTSAILTDNAIL